MHPCCHDADTRHDTAPQRRRRWGQHWRQGCGQRGRQSSRAVAASIAIGIALLLAVASWPATTVARDSNGLLELASFPRSTLTVHAANGEGHVFRIWIADSPERQQQGLMFVRDLPADEGMLFVNRESRPASMWMKNTFIPLDMLFIDSRGRVIRIFERTVPQSLATLSVDSAIKAVLEIRGGESARRGLRVGDRVAHPSFRAARTEPAPMASPAPQPDS